VTYDEHVNRWRRSLSGLGAWVRERSDKVYVVMGGRLPGHAGRRRYAGKSRAEAEAKRRIGEARALARFGPRRLPW
jgi:hypothetical protein